MSMSRQQCQSLRSVQGPVMNSILVAYYQQENFRIRRSSENCQLSTLMLPHLTQVLKALWVNLSCKVGNQNYRIPFRYQERQQNHQRAPQRQFERHHRCIYTAFRSCGSLSLEGL